MATKRNDPCPCGSGKKYKKCCLKNENVIEMQQVKEERFFEQKHMLVNKLREFIDRKITFRQYIDLKSEFMSRSNRCISEKAANAFVDYWLFYFRRFENGLRGIEWFYQEQGALLQSEEKFLLEQWTSLKPKVLQIVDTVDETVVLEDIFTKEMFKTPLTVEGFGGELTPWAGTISLIEPYHDLFYLNGVRMFEGPDAIERVEAAIKQKVEETGESYEEIIQEFYPELLATFVHKPETGKEKQEIKSFTLIFKMIQLEPIAGFLTQSADFIIEQWDANTKLATWAENWKKYKDSEMPSVIHIGDIYGSIEIKGDILTFITYHEEKIEEFKKRLNSLGDAIVFEDQQEESFYIPYNAEIKQHVTKTMTDETPEYFTGYAQANLLREISEPLPKYDNLSLKELVDSGRVKEAEVRLRQMEYGLYRHTKQQFSDAKVTADFNTMRKELNLPLSPFVTGGENRSSSLTPVEDKVATQKEVMVKRVDVPFYEDLGFEPETINNYYALDIVNFFKEKVDGKSGGTVRKYRNSLWDLRETLENIDTELNNWNDFNEELFTQLIAKDFPATIDISSKTQIKDFISVTKALTKWLDQHQKTNLSKMVTKVCKKVEPELISAKEGQVLVST